MPIKHENRQFYGAAWRRKRREILERAGNACEDCHVPNGALVARVDALPGHWFSLEGEHHDSTGWILGTFRGSELDADKLVAIKLGVAHLNRIPGDDRDENLRALCGHCHLKYDAPANTRQSKETRAAKKDAARPILRALMAEEKAE